MPDSAFDHRPSRSTRSLNMFGNVFKHSVRSSVRYSLLYIRSVKLTIMSTEIDFTELTELILVVAHTLVQQTK